MIKLSANDLGRRAIFMKYIEEELLIRNGIYRIKSHLKLIVRRNLTTNVTCHCLVSIKK